MDEDEIGNVETVGQRLRAAREAEKLSLDDVAAQTRIPVRHLASLENSDWESLPAPAYCVGFAKNYAGVVGLDRTEIGNELRAEMGTTRPTYSTTEVYEAADPKRTMPKWLIIGAIIGVLIVLLLLNWMRSRELAPADVPPAAEAPAAGAPVPPAPAPIPASTSQVTVTALQDVWIKVRDRDGAVLRQGVLKQGETFEVPSTATAPLLDTGRPEALRISVAGREIAAVGRPGRSVAGVSLLPADLMRTAATPASPTLSPATAVPATTSRTTAAPAAPTVAPLPSPPANEAAPANGAAE